MKSVKKIEKILKNNEHKRTFTSENVFSEKTANMPFSARNETLAKGILDKKASLPNLSKNLNFTINFKALMKMRNNPKFSKYSKKKTVFKQESLEEKAVDLKEIMGGLLQRAQKVLKIYSLKEKQWKFEREALKKEIFRLKNK